MIIAELRLTKIFLTLSGKIKNSETVSLVDTAYDNKSGTSINQTNVSRIILT